MRRTVVGCLIVAAAFTRCAGATTPLEAYGALPTVENIVLSPDGRHIAFVRTEGDQRFVAVVSLETGKPVAGAAAGDMKLRGVEWAGDGHVLIVSSVTRDIPWLTGGKNEWSQLVVLDVAARTMTLVPKRDAAVPMNVISGETMVRNVDGRVVLFVPGVHLREYLLPALYRYDVVSGEQELLEAGGRSTRQWFVDDAGNVAGRVEYDDEARRWSVQTREDGEYYVVGEGTSELYEPRILGFGVDGRTMLVAYAGDDDESSTWRLVPLREEDASPEFPEFLRDVSAPLHDLVTHHLIGGTSTSDRTHYEFAEASYRARWQSVLETFPDERVRLESASRNFDKVVVRVDGPTTGFEYVLIDLLTAQARPLGPVYDSIKERHETRPLRYTAADGLAIPGYLTLPTGKPPTQLPLVVLVHGGPAARDTADFDWWPQALASQGYAVLQPNFRGSTLGTDFVVAGFGEWGRKMQTDLSDGVRHLAKEGIVDPARVCIVGASYGGYAALAGATLDPGMYRCAVSVAGIGDVERMLEWEKRNSSERAQRFWDRFIGVDGPKDPIVQTISPADNAAAANVPVLLIHGKDDTVVPYEQSEAMLRALRRADKSAELVTLKREDHWLSRGETRVQMLQASVAFLRLHNPPD
jgi:dipeptidyl aminopeptidase/acylaminoacyl peptidase